MPTFEDYFAERVQPILTSPEKYPAAIEAIHDLFPLLETRLDRAKGYQWLGILHISLASEALALEEVDAAKEQFAFVEEFHVKSIEEEPSRLEPRLNLARYYLTFGDQHGAALEALDLPGDKADAALAEAPLEYQHQRIALRGVALALLGRADEAGECLDEAFSDRFISKIPSHALDVSSLNYLALRGFRLTPESVDAFLARLRGAGAITEATGKDLRAKLLGAMPED